jgi:hypothetical protein
VAEGIQIGRGFIAIDLDEAGARGSLDVLVQKIKETLREASKKTELDLDDTKADAELDRTNAKIKQVQQNAETPTTFGSGITQGARAAQQAIESASAAVTRARAKEEDATGKVRVAEQKLAEARAKYAADSSQVIGAEERLAAAERNVELAADRTRLATSKLSDARKVDTAATAAASSTAQGFGTTLTTISRALGLWAPALSVVTLAAQAGAGGILSVVGAVGNLLGVIGLVPAAGAVAVTSMAAITIGVANVGAALKTANTPAQLKAQNAAMAQLAPNAQDFVKNVRTIGPALKDLKLADQNALFAGLGKTIKSVAKDELPVLKTGLAGVAGALGAGFGTFLSNVASTQSLKNQALIFSNIRETLVRLTPAGVAFYNILTNITAVGSGLLPQLASGVTNLLDKFDRLIQHARSDGSLQRWMQNGITAAEALGKIVGNLGSILGALFKAGQTSGANFLGTLGQITGQFAAFLHTAQGQKDLSAILSSASDSAKVLVPLLKDTLNTLAGFAPILAPIANTLAPGVGKLITALGPALQNLDPGLKAIATGVTAILGAISQLLGPVSRLASDLGVGLGTTLQIVAGILVALLPILNAVASAVDFITRSTGGLIPVLAVAAVGILAFSKAQAFFTTGAAGKGIADAAKSIAEFGANAGSAIEKVTGSAKAGDAVTSLGSKIGSALKGVGDAIPFVGVALIGVSAVIEALSQHSKDLAAEAEAVGKGLVIGGSAGAEAAQKMAGYQQAIDKAKASLDAFNAVQARNQAAVSKKPLTGNLDQFAAQAQAVGNASLTQNDGGDVQALAAARSQLNAANAAAAAYRATLSDTQLAQVRVAQAQLDYNNAVRQFGANSAQARGALESLKSETQVETDAEYAATKATESHQQSLQDLMNQTLASANASANLKLAQLDLADAQKAAADATKKNGANSDIAVRAEAQYELQLNHTVQALHDKADADNASLPPSFRLQKTNADVTQGILDLALAAGKNAPAALLALVQKTYNANQAAIDAGASISGLHQQIITLPDGKKISISVDSNGQAYVQGLQNQLNALVRTPYVARVQLQGPSGPFSIVPVPHASGGPFKTGMPYWVGEQGPELVVPSRDGYVIPSSESRVMAAAGASAHASGPTLTQYNSFPIGLSEQQVADMAANSAAWKLKTAR